MKQLFFIGFVASCLTIYSKDAQSQNVGSVDKDGNYAITVMEDQAKQILEDVSHFTEPQPFQPTEITLTTMSMGEICLTGYIKNPRGHIVRGFRIMCLQDDANNLIVKPGSKVERCNGHGF